MSTAIAPTKRERRGPGTWVEVHAIAQTDEGAKPILFWVKVRIPAVREVEKVIDDALDRALAGGPPLEQLDIVSLIICGWYGFRDEQGAPAPFTRDDMRALCNSIPLAQIWAPIDRAIGRKLKRWLDQVNEFQLARTLALARKLDAAAQTV